MREEIRSVIPAESQPIPIEIYIGKAQGAFLYAWKYTHEQ
jgi:hypothetical protein